MILKYLLAIAIAINFATAKYTYKLGDTEIDFTATSNGIEIYIRDAEIGSQLYGTIGVGKNASCIDFPRCKVGDNDVAFRFLPGTSLSVISTTNNTQEVLKDCFFTAFPSASTQWYGGPERRVQTWPLQHMRISQSSPYISRKDDNHAVAERYWLNSLGIYIYLSEENPLFVSQNEDDSKDQVCFISKVQSPYINRDQNILEYVIYFSDDPKTAHLNAVNTYLGKPNGYPNPKMIKEPIWTTWAKYKAPITDDIVIEFAKSIRENGFENGQLEIDDAWEKCYGAQEFSEEKFSKISDTVKQLKDMDFRVTLWVHPFVNEDCKYRSDEGIQGDFFVKGVNGLNNATWWNGNGNGHQIDFTNPKAAEWYTDRLKKLQTNPGIDSFKFDAGEADYAEQATVFPYVSRAEQNLLPNLLTTEYIKTCANFGDLIEVRSAFRNQNSSNFVRMLDKDSRWDMQNGLPTLVTTLFQLNLNGYPLVLPDMIGGNGYGGNVPTAELIVRWTQANTFMPSMQFSYLPWEFNSDEFNTLEIVKKYVSLHEQYSDVIIKAMERSVSDGSPVNPPIWWIDPTDPVALACNDEYLVGEDILVAPVLEEKSRSRNVYLPRGRWRDGQNGTVYEGPLSFDYPADIDILPYFIKEDS
ncbi:myogenesis-regulating glycosidase-like isoform X2 [Diabrotica virgifera virgifera]|uniref:Myogenesis-regulating glycosidase-like n=1 Tax=Diabrotica virgifera virgifera TaxID=50390 RepID=A0ABM5JKC5_DIAVI|nr:myogenesis-regulating glycosidase-like isoform X2 [Diabrotica virgifera virgifera]